MKILVLGGNGMLGHKLAERLSVSNDLYATTRSDSNALIEAGIVAEGHLITRVDALDFGTVENAIEDVNPDCVINAVGMIKHRDESKNALLSIEINSALPHRLAAVSKANGARLVTFSTDCVFNGERGGYLENDNTDARDLYGRTKSLGELCYDHCLTIRSSIIGRELAGARSLLEWFLSEKGNRVKGFSKAIYSGLTTLEMANTVDMIIKSGLNLTGLYQISSEPINKYELLRLINGKLALGIEIEKDEVFEIDRSLNSEKFRLAAGVQPKSWNAMIDEFADDIAKYEEWRKLKF
jgi:dTDP-4-dehydrorhamnose reductase